MSAATLDTAALLCPAAADPRTAMAVTPRHGAGPSHGHGPTEMPRHRPAMPAPPRPALSGPSQRRACRWHPPSHFAPAGVGTLPTPPPQTRRHRLFPRRTRQHRDHHSHPEGSRVPDVWAQQPLPGRDWCRLSANAPRSWQCCMSGHRGPSPCSSPARSSVPSAGPGTAKLGEPPPNLGVPAGVPWVLPRQTPHMFLPHGNADVSPAKPSFSCWESWGLHEPPCAAQQQTRVTLSHRRGPIWPCSRSGPGPALA